jgi:hypothetical protein
MKSVSRFAFVVGVAWLLIALLPARADDQAGGAVALLARGQQLEDLRADGAVPFDLRAQIKATNGKRRVDGTYSLTWLDANRWHEELLVGDSRRIRDGVEAGYLQIRNPDSSQEEVVFRVDQALDVAKAMYLSSEARARDVPRRKIRGAVLACVEFRRGRSLEKDVCLDPTSGLLVRSKLQCPGWETDCIVDYEGSVEVGDRRFPSQIRSRSPDELSIEITVTSLKPFSGSVASLPVADPARSEFWRTCGDEIPPKGVNVPPNCCYRQGQQPLA